MGDDMDGPLDSRSNTAGATGRSASVDRELVRLLTQTLRQLGEAGQPDRANRLAGQAWSVARRTDPVAARRINGLMHYLARLPDPIDTPHNNTRQDLHTENRGN